MRVAVLAALLAVSSAAAFGGDDEFERIVKAIETRYGAKPVHIPFMGVASLVVKVAHPEGAKALKLAIFEDLKDLRLPDDPGAWRERDRFMDSLAGKNLHPMVRVHSRNGEATYIFANPEKNATRMLIATFERDQATVIEVKADFERMLRSLENPAHAKDSLAGEP